MNAAAGAVAFSLEKPDRAALQSMWTALEPRADITFYLSWAWIGAWTNEAGMPDHVLIGRADGEIVCLGLLRRGLARRHGLVRSRTLYLHQTGHEEQDIIFIEYNGLLTDLRFGRLEPQAIDYLRLHQSQIGRFDEVQLGGIAAEGYRALRTAGLRTHIHAHKTTAFVDLSALRASGSDYLSTVSANTRQQIRRAIKLYEARGPLHLEPARSTEQALTFFEEMGVLHGEVWRSRGSGGAWTYPFMIAFHRRIIAEQFTHGGIDIVRVRCGDRAIGYIHCLVRGGWIGSYLSGFAYEEDNKARPGLVSFYLYIQHKLKSDAQALDFLAGDHRYKMSLGRRGPDMYWLTVREPRPLLLMEDALRWFKQTVLKR